MKILYLPIFEGGSVHETAITNKRGLYNALVAAGHNVTEVDYLARLTTLRDDLNALVDTLYPDLILTQLHGADILSADDLRHLKRHGATVVNWSGDSWRHSLVSEAMLDMLRGVDLQLVAAPEVLPEYAAHGIPAAFWNIAYEAPVGELPDMPAYDIVFLANTITGERRALFEWLRTIDYTVGIYGDWEHADGHNVYNFGAGEALYKKAKFAICDNPYPDQRRYISNRPMQALIAGGAMVMHQHVPEMQDLSGMVDGVHYVEWVDTADLRDKLNDYREHEDERVVIVNAGRELALAKHTYTERVRELFEELLPMIEGVKA